jgi:hypothetical protein
MFTAIERLVLVNPATSYDRTIWPLLGNLIAKSGSAFPAVGIGMNLYTINTLIICLYILQWNLNLSTYFSAMTAALMATVVQPEQFISVGQVIAARINSTDAAIKEMNELLATGSKLVDLMPPETLKWRLNEWLLLGSFLMNDRSGRLHCFKSRRLLLNAIVLFFLNNSCAL